MNSSNQKNHEAALAMFNDLKKILAKKELYRYDTFVEIRYVQKYAKRHVWRVRIGSSPVGVIGPDKIYVYVDLEDLEQAREIEQILEDMRAEPKKGPGIAPRTVVYSIIKIFLSFIIIYDVMNHLSAMINR